MNRDKGQPVSSLHEADRPQTQHSAASDLSETAAIIAKDITISGCLCGRGTVLVEGTVIGEIKLDGPVSVAKTGVVKGPIEADAVDVAGCVEGDIAARTYLRLKMTGSITGDVTISSFTIEDGGYFNGQSHMTKAGGEPVIIY